MNRYKVPAHQKARGEAVATAKITEEDAIDIYNRAWEGQPLKWLSEDYGLSITSISDIKRGKTWRHVTRHIDRTQCLSDSWEPTSEYLTSR